MNEKIKELRNKALEKYVFTDVDGDNNHGIKLNEEKFAELIIRECDRYVAERFDECEPWMSPGDLLNHFGVEE